MDSDQRSSYNREEEFKQQVRLLELVASQESFGTLLNSLTLFVERFAPEMRCCILIADPAAQLLHVGAAPNLPTAFVRAIDGTPIREGQGSCGTAAFRREPVIVDDIARSPLWETQREMARAHGLAACWSMPLFDNTHELIGTFAMYYDVPRLPGLPQTELLRVAASLAGIIIQRFRDAEGLRTNELRYRELAERCPDPVIAHVEGRFVFINEAARALLQLQAGGPGAGLHLEQFLPEHSRNQLLSHRAGPLSSQLRVGDGKLLHVEIAANKLTFDHQLATVWVVRDVSQRIAGDSTILEAENRQQEQLAFDLHDGLGQQLTGLSLLLRGLTDKVTATLPSTAADFKTIAELVSKSIGDIRILAGSMSPVTVERAGLAGALKTLREKAERIYGLSAHLSIQPSSGWTLASAVAAHLSRIAQEAIANAARHAKATQVELDGRVVGPDLVITITDDGIGIPDATLLATGLGLRGMRYRAERIGAQLEIKRHLPHGTTVQVRYPWPAEA